MKEETLTLLQDMTDRYKAIYEHLECELSTTAKQRLALRLTSQQIRRLESLLSTRNN
ncbi:hypothetical protein [Aneurinibacillus migulanus]|uniref:Uncharacterized protein n=1 Tax=Aneurinibacillus migulanus TaxID=47500 RepID=A0A1G8N5U6_ANEMI|nr:hypothetical protein [Aneurinibacillus migulanus]MCP1357317.1 hypothetical protein [Aneurinibacillus migulanus]MED0894506.1 hypothetical protein [Aneurinibacillus migulanus]MED1616202.1 hypothetical protein [Aneurinibacillus migulanus]SDI75437.1 hypothetical protein SAMN04487909_107108 [Aneurinibacillus migulanus]GED13624.1 hypothetical protein AMI01nite_16150 [Aneurinibacillus migulanus]